MTLNILLTTIFSITSANYQGCTPRCQGCKVMPVELRSIYNSTTIIGAMFPVHYWNGKKFVLNKPGLLWIEAMLYAIEEINNSTELLHTTKLGYRIHDSCNDIEVAIESALELTQGFFKDSVKIENTTTCNCKTTSKRAISLIGDASSSTTTRVAALLSSTSTTQISYSATSTDLNAKQLYPSFLRTISPDNVQAIAISDLMVFNNWTYINIIACDDQYGRVGLNELLPRLKEANICVAFQEIFDIKNDRDDIITNTVIKNLLQETEATVIVLWCQRPEALRVLKVAEKLRLYNRTWIATEAYGNTEDVYRIDEQVVGGMFGIVPLQISYKPFIDRLHQITPDIVDRNPWISEYWKERQCNITNNTYGCLEENINLASLPQSKHIEVINAIYSIAHGLESYRKTNKNLVFEPREFLKHVKNVSFIGKNNLMISYNELGNPKAAAYSITNLNATKTSKSWKNIGTWDYLSRKIKFKLSDIIFAGGTKQTPKSSCKENCKPGYYGLSFDKSCCWKCINCAIGTVQPNFGQDSCIPCIGEQVTNLEKTICIKPKQEYLRIKTREGIILVSLIIIATFLEITTLIIFYLYRETPIVKAFNYNLSMLQLISIWLNILFPAFFLQNYVSTLLCGAQLLYFVCFNCITISVTFTKADRLLRIFNASETGRISANNKVKTNKFQYFTVTALTFLGMSLCVALSFGFPIHISKQITRINNNDIKVTYYCSGYFDSILFIMIGYLVIIALICGVYAFKARKLPDGYNEARFTSFAMFIYLLSWLMFIPIYFSTNHYPNRVAAWCILSFIAIGSFLAMYFSKIYHILFKPDKNTNKQFRANITAFSIRDTSSNNVNF